MQAVLKILKTFVVITGAIFLSTLAINAADTFQNPENSMLAGALAGLGTDKKCPEGMGYIGTSTGGYCVDVYEASPGEGCPVMTARSAEDTRKNLASKGCIPVSVKGVIPWRGISQDQAARACAAAGKRLPTNEEWFSASLGTPDPSSGWGSASCNVFNNRSRGEPSKTGSGAECVSSFGMYDMSGNVWEWVRETAKDGKFSDMALPESGFVTGADEKGVPSSTSGQADENYNGDRFWIKKDGVAGMFRGGFWSSGADAGIYTVHAGILPSFSGAAVGFRCVK